MEFLRRFIVRCRPATSLASCCTEGLVCVVFSETFVRSHCLRSVAGQ